MADKENQIVTPECPDIELLSAWFDGEENLSEAQKEHIKTCKACAARLADYKGICTSMKKEFTCQELNNEWTERILSQTRCMIRKQIDTVKLEKQEKMRTRIIWGIRFGLLLLAIVFFTLLMLREKKGAVPAPAPKAQTMTIKGPAFSAFKVPKKVRTYQTADAFSSSVSSLELALDNDIFCSFERDSAFRLEIPTYIPPTLTQFWYCTSFSAERLKGHLGDLKKTLQLKKLDIVTSDEKNTFPVEMVFGGNARQFTVFIKQLAAWGLTQLDVAQPRNERSFFFGDGESVIVCRFLIQIPKDGGKYNLPVK